MLQKMQTIKIQSKNLLCNLMGNFIVEISVPFIHQQIFFDPSVTFFLLQFKVESVLFQFFRYKHP